MSRAGYARAGVLAMLALLSLRAAAQQTVEISIQDYKFVPAEVRIKAGDTVKWINREKRTSHSVLFPAENGLESERMFPQEHWQRSFPQPGSYSYRCGPHEEMKGRVLVE
ncbi:MAG: cupredoxin domain-containing protein [Sulfuritalea sp.]|nr:cupredoxin domain-containing protein [Sulfuritalea sp.]